MKRTTEYRQTKLSFSRAVIYGLSPIPQKEVFYDATGGPFTHTKVEFLMELYDKEGIAGVIPCTSLMEERLLPLVRKGRLRSGAGFCIGNTATMDWREKPSGR